MAPGAPSPTVTLAGVTAVDFYLRCMSSGGSIPENFASDGDKRRAKLACDIFNAFTKPEERLQLLPRAAGIEGEKVPVVKEVERQQLGRKLESLVVARLSLSYTDNGLALPRPLRARSRCWLEQLKHVWVL